MSGNRHLPEGAFLGYLIKNMGKKISLFAFLLLVAADAGASSGSLAQQILEETNLVRREPQRYVGFLQEFRQRFRGKNYLLPDSDTQVITNEGVEALDEAINFLSTQAPLPPLTGYQGLSDAAADLVHDQGETGDVGHGGRRSGDMKVRIERHGTWKSRIAENIGYGPYTARLMVMELIIDDGVPGRGHRKNIFTRDFAVAGVACGPHPRYRNMCVMEFAAGYQSRKR